MKKYYTEAHIEYKDGKNNSVSSVDIKKAYVYYAGAPDNEIVLKYPDWFGCKLGYHTMTTDAKKALIKLPLCDSPEEYKKHWESILKETHDE